MSRTSDAAAGWSRAAAALAMLCCLIGAPAGLANDPGPGLMRVRMAQFDPESSWAQADILVMGARVFDNRCSPCHGSRGLGDGELADVLPIRPRSYPADNFKWGSSPSRIATTVAGGRSGIMPPFKGALTEQEIWAVAYVVWRWIPEERRSYDDPEAVRRWTLP